MMHNTNNHYNHFLACPKPEACDVATWIVRAIVERTFPSSRARRPAIVQPPGAG